MTFLNYVHNYAAAVLLLAWTTTAIPPPLTSPPSDSLPDHYNGESESPADNHQSSSAQSLVVKTASLDSLPTALLDHLSRHFLAPKHALALKSTSKSLHNSVPVDVRMLYQRMHWRADHVSAVRLYEFCFNHHQNRRVQAHFPTLESCLRDVDSLFPASSLSQTRIQVLFNRIDANAGNDSSPSSPFLHFLTPSTSAWTTLAQRAQLLYYAAENALARSSGLFDQIWVCFCGVNGVDTLFQFQDPHPQECRFSLIYLSDHVRSATKRFPTAALETYQLRSQWAVDKSTFDGLMGTVCIRGPQYLEEPYYKFTEDFVTRAKKTIEKGAPFQKCIREYLYRNFGQLLFRSDRLIYLPASIGYMLERNPPVDRSMHMPISSVDRGFLKFLIANGLSLDVCTTIGLHHMNPILFVVEDVDLMLLLLEAGASTEPPFSNAPSLPLIEASYRGSVDSVRLLLDFGADPNADDGGHFPLILTRSVEIAKLLAAKGAQLDKKLPNGHNALYFALRGSSLDMLNFLLDAGAAFSSHHLFHIRHPMILDALLTRDPSLLNRRDSTGLTPLAYFARQVEDDASDMMTQYPEVFDRDQDCKALALFLIYRGADSNLPNALGRTPLFMATNLEIIRALVMEGHADMNVRDVKGNTAFREAAKYGYIQKARLLLQLGAESSAADRSWLNDSMKRIPIDSHDEDGEWIRWDIRKRRRLW